MRALIDLLNEAWIDLNTELLGFGVLIVQHCNTFADRLVVVNVLDAFDKVSNVKLFLELEVQNLGLVCQLHIDVDLRLFDGLEHLMERIEVVCGHSVTKTLLSVRNILQAVIKTADRSLWNQTILVFEYPVLSRAQPAVELAAALTEELNVSEVEF